MSPEKSSKPTKLCPTCGTRVVEDASRCPVCGANLTITPKVTQLNKQQIQGTRMPEITMSMPAALGFLMLFLAIGAALVYIALRNNKPDASATQTPTVTYTVTPSVTPTAMTPTTTNTPEPSPTPLSYKVSAGDTCSSIAFAFKISIQSIVLLNDLPATCDNLYVGQPLLIPQPTPTASPMPTATLSSADATDAACTKIDYVVQDNDTLSSISLNYNIQISVLKSYNGLVNDTVRSGQTIIIPLCERKGTPGPTPTPTPPPPYPAPNLLLPPDGAPFTTADDLITLQWASVSALRSNESYVVTIMDITDGTNRKIVQYVNETKFIVPISFRPTDNRPHVIRWWVSTARQISTDESGNPVWDSAGASSLPRDFIWIGNTSGGAAPTP